jgi:hypothetical protein
MNIRNLSIGTIAGIALALVTGASAKMFFVYEGVDVNDAIVVNIGEEYSGSTVGATCTDESSCGYNDKHAVWHSYTPQSDQTVTISLCGSTFNTTLAVFDACEGTELACNDNYCGLQSELTLDLIAGQTYLIRVAGYNDQMGDYTLTIVETTRPDLNIGLTIDNLWMYQNLPGNTASRLTATVSIVDDLLNNRTYTYRWEFVLPVDVNVAPAIIDGGSANDAFCTFAALGCDQPKGLSNAGLPYKIRVIVTGNDYGNTATAEAEFGISLLGDINNDTVVDVADRSIVNAFCKFGVAGSYSLRDCDVNCDGVVDVADRSITNAICVGTLGRNFTAAPCRLR